MMILSVDEAGTFLVALETELVLGHLRDGSADLPFLADVGPRHARLERTETFRDGAVWRIAPLAAEPVITAGETVPDDGRALVDGDVVELGVNLAFRFRRPDPASTSAVLDLLHGTECLGCRGIVLLGSGPSGRLSIGPGSRCHLRAGGLQEDARWLSDTLRNRRSMRRW